MVFLPLSSVIPASSPQFTHPPSILLHNTTAPSPLTPPSHSPLSPFPQIPNPLPIPPSSFTPTNPVHAFTPRSHPQLTPSTKSPEPHHRKGSSFINSSIQPSTIVRTCRILRVVFARNHQKPNNPTLTHLTLPSSRTFSDNNESNLFNSPPHHPRNPPPHLPLTTCPPVYLSAYPANHPITQDIPHTVPSPSHHLRSKEPPLPPYQPSAIPSP